MASEKQHVTQWEDFMKEQHSKQAEVDEEHRKAMEKLREQSSMRRQPFGAARPTALRLSGPASLGSYGPVSLCAFFPAASLGLRRNAGAHVEPHCACAEAAGGRKKAAPPLSM